MEIVVYGHIKPTRVGCHKCGAQLKYVPRDVKTMHEKSYINCPICGAAIMVENAQKKTAFPWAESVCS